MSDHTRTLSDEGTATASRRPSLLVTLTVAVFIVGAIVAAVIWILATGSTGEDIAILTVCITFTLMIALMSVRELLQAGKKVNA